MPRRSPILRYQVALTPRGDDVDVTYVRDYLRNTGAFRYVGLDADGSIDIGVNAPNIDEAEDRVKSWLDDEDRHRFIVGHPPL